MIIDLIKEFAAIPDREGVLKNFSKEKDAESDYSLLKSEIEAMEEAPVIPDIKDFIFGEDANTIQERIRSVISPFMLIDYGIIRGSDIFKTGGSNVQLIFNCLIAAPGNTKNRDLVEQVIMADKLLDYVRQIIKHFEEKDKDRCASMRMLDGEMTISPIDPYVLLNCVGWDISFVKNASSLLF